MNFSQMSFILANGLFNFAYYFFVCFVTFYPKYTYNSAKLTGLYLGLIFVGNIISEPITSVFVDSGKSKTVVKFALLSTIFTVLSLYGCLEMGSSYGDIVIGLACLVFGTASASVRPAIYSASKKMDNMTSVNAYLMVGERIAMVLGSGLGLFIYKFFGPHNLILCILGFSILGLFSFWNNLKDRQSLGEKSSFHQFSKDLVEGLRYVWNRKDIRAIFSFLMIVNIFYPPSVSILLPYLIEENLKLGFHWYSLAVVIQGLAVILGMMVFKKNIADMTKRKAYFRNGLICLGMGLFCFAFATDQYLIILGSIFTGMSLSCTRLASLTQLQDVVPSDKVGRTVGLLTVFASALVPLSMAIFGFMMDAIHKDTKFLYITIGLILILSSTLFLFWKSLNLFFKGPLIHEA